MEPYIVILIVICAIVLFIALIIPAAKRGINEQPRRKDKVPERKREDEGEAGEEFVAGILKRCLLTEHDHLMNGVILYDPRRKASCEIDHILISERGVFVIETKNRSGEIYGDDTREEWTQVLAGGEIVHTMRSPVLQNATHVRFVKEILYRRVHERVPVTGLVVFAQGNTRHIDSEHVCSPFGIEVAVKTQGREISPADQDRAYRTLRSHLEKYPITKEEHLQYIRSIHPDERE